MAFYTQDVDVLGMTHIIRIIYVPSLPPSLSLFSQTSKDPTFLLRSLSVCLVWDKMCNLFFKVVPH